MADRGSSRRELKERALVRAGFGHRSARALAWLGTWVGAIAAAVALLTGLWLVADLWPSLDAEAWRSWVESNPSFFDLLEPGDRVGLVPDLHDHTGLLLTRTAGGVAVELRLWFDFDGVDFGMVVPPEAAAAWLALEFDGSEDAWRNWRALARTHGVRYYAHLQPDSDSSAGYRRLLEHLRSPAAAAR